MVKNNINKNNLTDENDVDYLYETYFEENTFHKKIFFKRLILYLLVILISIALFIGIDLKLFGQEIETIKKVDYVSLGGESIGLDLNTGVFITGKFSVSTANGSVKPWNLSNIEDDDMILSIDNQKVERISDIRRVVIKEKEYDLTLLRDNKNIYTKITGVKNQKNNEITLGLYVKDNMLGIGTLSFYDIKSKSFAALGHNACEKLVSGNIRTSYVNGINKGVRGIPGEKKATLGQNIIGKINLNNEFGIFGELDKVLSKNDMMAIANTNDVHVGKATITTVIKGNEKETFDIEIVEAKKQSIEDIKGIKFLVTDEDLLEQTGGIIQGMSGSPICQDGKIVGAVSHVLVDNSKTGYGVYAEFMATYM